MSWPSLPPEQAYLAAMPNITIDTANVSIEKKDAAIRCKKETESDRMGQPRACRGRDHDRECIGHTANFAEQSDGRTADKVKKALAEREQPRPRSRGSSPQRTPAPSKPGKLPQKADPVRNGRGQQGYDNGDRQHRNNRPIDPPASLYPACLRWRQQSIRPKGQHARHHKIDQAKSPSSGAR